MKREKNNDRNKKEEEKMCIRLSDVRISHLLQKTTFKEKLG